MFAAAAAETVGALAPNRYLFNLTDIERFSWSRDLT